MKKIGIVVEYNPFHNGHLYQIKKIKEIFGENTFIVIVMSGNYVQRGEYSFLSKWEKTEIALNYGIDLVIELPLYYSIQNAEIFSKMSTKILDYLNVDIQVFGAEENNISSFYNIIELQKSSEYKQKIKNELKDGKNYVLAQKKVLEKYGHEKFYKSNNILALEYIRTIVENNLDITPYIIKREISEYNEVEVSNDRNEFVSASYIREKFINDDKTYLKQFVPEKTFEIINKKVNNGNFKEKIFNLLKYKILSNHDNNIEIYDLTIDIMNRLKKILEISKTYEQFIKNIQTRNISIKRIDRILLNLLFNITYLDFEIDYVRVLGFNSKGREYLKKLKENKKNIYVNWKDIEKNVDSYKINIEKNAFIIDEIFYENKERLNPIIWK